MGDLARYRLFLTFLAVPVVVVVLVIFLIFNSLGTDEQAVASDETEQVEALAPPTLAVSVVTVAPANTIPVATVTPTPTVIATGTATSIPQPTTDPNDAPTAAPTPTAVPTVAPAGTPQEYEVQANDTLSQIADRFGLTTSELADFNDLENLDDIQIGDILVIPASASLIPATPAPSPTPTPTPISATVDPVEGLNLREDATTEAEVVEILPAGAEILLTGAKQTIGDIEWVELVDGGWVQSQYLTIASDEGQ